MKSPPNAAPLGYWPSVQTVYHDRCAGAGTVVQVAAVRGPLTEDLLRAAARQERARQPLLRARLCNRRRLLWAEEAEPAAEPPVLLETTTAAALPWPALAAREVARGFFEPDRPLWRVLLRTLGPDEHEVVVVMHHGVGDARATVSLLAALLRRCSADLAGAPLPAGPELPLLAGVDDLLLPPDPAPATTEAATQPPAPTAWPWDQAVGMDERAPVLLPLALEELSATALRDAARARGASVQGALMAAALRALRAAGAGAEGVAVSSAVDLRRFCVPAPAPDAMGCFITLVNTVHGPPDGQEFWELARASGDHLRATLEARRRRGLVPRRFRVPLLEALLAERLRQAETERCFPEGLTLSNLGLVALPPSTGPFLVHRLHFTTAHPSGLYGAFFTLLALGDRLFGLLSCPTPLISVARTRRMADECAQQLVTAVAGG